MQVCRMRQEVHYPLLTQKTHLYTCTIKAVHLCHLLQEFCTRTVPQGAHLHPHWAEAIQVPIPRLHKGLPPSWKAIPSQEASPEQAIHRLEGQEEKPASDSEGLLRLLSRYLPEPKNQAQPKGTYCQQDKLYYLKRDLIQQRHTGL